MTPIGYEISKIVKLTELSREQWVPEAGDEGGVGVGEGSRSCYLVSRKLQLCRMKMF